MLILMLCIGLMPALHAKGESALQNQPGVQAPYQADFVMPEFPGTRQDTLVAQYPNTTIAVGMACQHDPVYPFDAWLLDDVTPASGNYNVERVISWWANWNGFTSWANVPEIYFQVYEDSGLAYPYPKMMPSQQVTVTQANYTATTIGTDQYLVEMNLPSTVVLPSGQRSWICVQPNNQFAVNGQTGWMGNTGIGNGQECYFAFPLLGNNKWVTATSVFGSPNEAGFVLMGTEGAGAAHDVGVNSILEPTGTYSLNDVVTPSAQVRNFGQNDETFPVIFNIERNSVLVYADTVTITVDSGEVDTAVFAQFTFTQSGTYDIECHTELVGDENPANDTTFATVSVFQWAEDFEATNGGFVADPAAGGWEWGVPTSGPGSAHSGTNLWGTILAGAYYDNANWKLSSGVFAATENNPHLFFYNWYDIETGWDGGNVKYSTDNGTTWTLLHPVGGYDGVANTANVAIPAESCFTGHPAAWVLEEIIIPVTSGQTFQIRFHFGTDGSVTYPGWYIDDLAGVGLVGIEENVIRIPSGTYSLFAATPNPMTHSTRIAFNMPQAAKATLRVYDIQGRLVATLLQDTEVSAGMHDVVWRGTDTENRQLPAGVYFYELKTPDYKATEKLIITR